MNTNLKELAGLIGGLLWLASWVISTYFGFSESTAQGWTLLVTGITGPVAGVATGLLWGNWLALVLGAIGWGFMVIAPDLLKKQNRVPKHSAGRGPCGRYAQWLEAERIRQVS
ncbi:hypothetical protein GKN94_11325 [Candidatus Lucifugimonas marina]|uniref:hypothetical protein n=1 Tax=Candidatus Lucifugimonas marina TaxID=3038979 RepID=UPI00279EB768|nr:hypothetical protein GKN94_11325 [SAR202 cluster bacterium JH545]